jgi:hypothetical protein
MKVFINELIKGTFILYFLNNSPFVNCYITVIPNLYYITLARQGKEGKGMEGRIPWFEQG